MWKLQGPCGWLFIFKVQCLVKVKIPSRVPLFIILTGKIMHLSKAWSAVSLFYRLYASSFSKQSHFISIMLLKGPLSIVEYHTQLSVKRLDFISRRN